MEDRERQVPDEVEPGTEPGQPGAEGGPDSPDADKLPGTPTSSDAELGDTDQHSNA